MILMENELFEQFVLLSVSKIYFFWQKYTSQTKCFFGSLSNWSLCLFYLQINFHLTDNRLWKYNLAMCKDKYYILVGYALSKLANFARTSMLHFLIIFQELSYLVTPASSLVRSCDMLQLFFTPHNMLPALFDV